MKVAFVYNDAQYKSLGLLPKDVSIATCNIDVAARCEAENRHWIDLSEQIEGDVIEQVESETLEIIDLLAEALSNTLPGEYAVLSPHVAHELYYTLKKFCCVQRMIESTCRAYRISKAIIFREQTRVYFWDPETTWPDILNAATATILMANSILCEYLVEKVKVSALGTPPDNLKVLKYPQVDVSLIPCKYVLVWQAGLADAECSFLYKTLSESARSVAVVPIFWWTTYFKDSDEKILAPAVSAAFQRVAYVHARLRALAQQPLAVSLLRDWSKRIAVALAYYRFGRALVRALRPWVVLQGSDVAMQSRCFAEGVRQEGAEPLTIWHGGLSSADYFTHRNRGAIGHLAVWSDAQKHSLIAERSREYLIQPIGSFRPELDLDASVMQARHHTKTNNATILILNARLENLCNTMTNIQALIQYWRDLYALADTLNNYRFLIKTHPRYDYFHLYHVSQKPANIELITGPLNEALARSDVIVVPNCATTAAMEAVVAGRPVVICTQALKPWYREYLQDMRSIAIVADDIATLKKELMALVHNHSYYEFACENARAAYRRVLPKSGKDAVLALWNWMEQLCEASASRCEKLKPDDQELYFLSLCRWLDASFLHRQGKPVAPCLKRDAPGRSRRVNRVLVTALIHRTVWTPWPKGQTSRIKVLWELLGMLKSTPPLSCRICWPYVEAAMQQDATNSCLSLRWRWIASAGVRACAMARKLRRGIIQAFSA